MNSLVSVIVPAYNQASYLPVALDAVLAQTYLHWECIIVNDGSPDNSEEIAFGYCAKDARFKYLKKENGGLSSARNAGLKIAEGEWIQFLDSDDYLEPGKLELSLAVLKSNPATELVVSDFKMFVDQPQTATKAFCELNQKRLTFENILLGWDVEFNIPIHCGLFKATLFAQNPFVESLKVSEDFVMWINIFKKNTTAVYLNQPLAYYRINPNSMTKDPVFLRNSLVEAYKYILQILPQQYVYKFTCAILDRLNVTMGCQHDELVYLRTKPYNRFEKKAGDFLRRFLAKR